MRRRREPAPPSPHHHLADTKLPFPHRTRAPSLFPVTFMNWLHRYTTTHYTGGFAARGIKSGFFCLLYFIECATILHLSAVCRGRGIFLGPPSLASSARPDGVEDLAAAAPLERLPGGLGRHSSFLLVPPPPVGKARALLPADRLYRTPLSRSETLRALIRLLEFGPRQNSPQTFQPPRHRQLGGDWAGGWAGRAGRGGAPGGGGAPMAPEVVRPRGLQF